MYPGVSDYDELVAKEMPAQAFIQLKRQMHSNSGSKNGHETHHGNGNTRNETLEMRQQAYAELLSRTHPQKLTVIGTDVSVDFFDFRDAVNKLEAQMMLVSPTEVTEAATYMVRTFVDCIVAKEQELRKEAEREEKNLGKAHVLESTKGFNDEFDRLSDARKDFIVATQKDIEPESCPP